MPDNPDIIPEKKIVPVKVKSMPADAEQVSDATYRPSPPQNQKPTRSMLLPIVLGSICIVLILVALSLRNKVSARDEAVTNGENRLTQLQTRMEPLLAQVEDAKLNAVNLQKQIDEAKSGAILLKGDLEKAGAANAELQAQLEKARENSTAFQLQMEEAKVASIKQQGEVEAAQAAGALLQAQLTKSEAEITKLRAEQVASLAQITELSAKLAKAETEVTRLQKPPSRR